MSETLTEDVQLNYLKRFTEEMGNSDTEVVGRENELIALDATMHREVMRNLLLLAPPGAGKTAIVEAWAHSRLSTTRTFSVDLVAMGGEGSEKFAEYIKKLVDEVIELSKVETKNIVLFIDEVHMLGMDAYAVGLEALKPAMARGSIKLIGATTDEEYTDYIESNQALYQRFQRLDVAPPTRDVVVLILENLWLKAIPNEPINKDVIDKIIDYGIYFPADAQPRKSIKLLDDMIGWHRSRGIPMTRKLLNERVQASSGVNPEMDININSVIKNMERRVKGQEHAIEALEGALQISVAGIGDKSRPQGSFIFTGSTGVGKTELAKAIAEGIFGSQDRMIRFDMSEFKTIESLETFRFRISDEISKFPFSIVLLDEIEKAHPNIYDLLLQITDDGRLTNRYGRQVTFKNAFIVMTTNIGSEMFDEINRQGVDVQEIVEQISNLIGNITKPEFVGRIDAIVPFAPLKKEVRRQIAVKELTNLVQRVGEVTGVRTKVTERVSRYLTEEEVSRSTKAGGGRDIKRKIKNDFQKLLATEINRRPNLVYIRIGVLGQMAVDNKTMLRGDSQLAVIEYAELRADGEYDLYIGSQGDGVSADDVQAEYRKVTDDYLVQHGLRMENFSRRFRGAQLIK